MARRGRPEKAGSAFLILWMTFWLAAILVAAWTMGAAALSGEPAAAIVLLVWIGAALFGLVSAGRSLRAALLGERPRRTPLRNHQWNDGLDPSGASESAAPDAAPGTGDVPPPPPADAGEPGPRS